MVLLHGNDYLLTIYLGFYMNLPIGLAALVLLVLIDIPDITVKAPFSMDLVKKVIPQLDLVGFGLFVPAALMFLLALQWGGNDYAWNSPVVICLFWGAGFAAIAFVFWERRVGEKAMIPASILKNRIAMSSAVQVGVETTLL